MPVDLLLGGRHPVGPEHRHRGAQGRHHYLVALEERVVFVFVFEDTRFLGERLRALFVHLYHAIIE